MSKKKEKVSYEQLDKKGIVQTGFVKLDNKLRVQISVDCGPYGLALYVALLSHYNYTTDKCFPSVETLSKETGISKRKISDVLNDLSDYDYIRIRSGGTHHTNTYWFPKQDFFTDSIETDMAYRRKRLNPNKKNETEDLPKQDTEVIYSYNDDLDSDDF